MTALFVVLTFVLFITVDLLVLKLQKKKHPAFLKVEDKPVFNKRTIAHPENAFISNGHTWVSPLSENLAKIGVDDFILKALGKIVLKPLVKEGDLVNKGDKIFETSIGSTVMSFYSPFNGIVKEINREVLQRSIQHSFNDWGLIISSSEIQKNLAGLKTGANLSNWLKEEFLRLKDFLSVNSRNPEFAGITMQDGGNIVEGIVSIMDSDVLKNFEKQFLQFKQ